MPFKANADRRHRIPKERQKVTNWAEYDAGLRARGSLTVWFTAEAIGGWRAEARSDRGGQAKYSDLAIATAPTLRTVFRLALRQTEGLIASILQLLGLDLAVPDHSTLSRGAETLKVLTSRDADNDSQVGPLLNRVGGSVASFTDDGAYDWDNVYAEVAAHHPNAAVVVPPRASAVSSGAAQSAPTQRDGHLRSIAECGRMGWQRASAYNWRALVEADNSRWKRVIGDRLRSQTDGRQATEVAIATKVLNHRLELGRPEFVRIA